MTLDDGQAFGLLRAFLDGSLDEDATAQLLDVLAVDEGLRDMLEELRDDAMVPPTPGLFAPGAASDGPSDPLAVSRPARSGPYRLARVIGAQMAFMGPDDDGTIFGPSSRMELELHPTAELESHLPAVLMCASPAGHLAPSIVEGVVEDDTLVFAARGSAFFPGPGLWTLCALVGPSTEDARRWVGQSLQDALRSVLLKQCITVDSIYRP